LTGRAYDTLAQAKRVAERFDFCRRLQNLSWSHHQEVASLKDAAQADDFLRQAESNGWSQRELRRQVSQAKAARAIDAAEPGERPRRQVQARSSHNRSSTTNFG
jgi:hypothetical protein